MSSVVEFAQEVGRRRAARCLDYRQVQVEARAKQESSMPVSTDGNSPSPDSVINTARKVNPTTTRIFYGGYVVLAMAAAIVSWKVAPRSLIEVAILLVVLTVVASLLTRALTNQKLLAARVLLWAILAAIVVSLASFVSASIFGWPEPAKIIVARFLGQELLRSTGGKGR
jgi:hypothetical protein